MILGLEFVVEGIAAILFLASFLLTIYNHQHTKADPPPITLSFNVVASLVWLLSCFIAIRRVETAS